MANHRAQAQFDRAGWRLALLGPLWVLQITLALSVMGLSSWRLGDTLKQYGGRRAKAVEIAWEAANMAMSLVAGGCSLVEMARFAGEALTPWTMLVTHAVKLACAGAMLGLDVVVYVRRSDARYPVIGLALDAAMIAVAAALAVYAVLTYRRLRAYDDYARPANVRGYGFSDAGRLRSGFAESRRLSMASPSAYTVEGGAYSHERDTQFDEYLARHRAASHTSFGSERHALGAVPEEDAPRDREPRDWEPRDREPRDREAFLGRSRAASEAAESGIDGPPVHEVDLTELRGWREPGLRRVDGWADV